VRLRPDFLDVTCHAVESAHPTTSYPVGALRCDADRTVLPEGDVVVEPWPALLEKGFRGV
jgi:hypothetical protein